MHVICTATAPDGHITHHLVLAESGGNAVRQLKPLLSPGSRISTASVPEYMRRHGRLPETLCGPTGKHTTPERVIPADILALGRTAAANPDDFWNQHDHDRPGKP